MSAEALEPNPFEQMLGGDSQILAKLKAYEESLLVPREVVFDANLRWNGRVVYNNESESMKVVELGGDNFGKSSEWRNYVIQSGQVKMLGTIFTAKGSFGLRFNRNMNINFTTEDLVACATSELPSLVLSKEVESKDILSTMIAGVRRTDSERLERYSFSSLEDRIRFSRDLEEPNVQAVELVNKQGMRPKFLLGVEKIVNPWDRGSKLKLVLPVNNWNTNIAAWCLSNHRLAEDPAMRSVDPAVVIDAIEAIQAAA